MATELQGNNISNSAGTGAPNFPFGLKSAAAVAPSAGQIGELITNAPGSPVSMGGSGSFQNVTSISLTAGIWDVFGVVSASGATSMTSLLAATSLTSGAQDIATGEAYNLLVISGGIGSTSTMISPVRRFVFSSTTTVYLLGFAVFSVAGNYDTASYFRATRVA